MLIRRQDPERQRGGDHVQNSGRLFETDWRDAAMSRGTPGAMSWGRQLPELGENKSVVLSPQFVVICYGCRGKSACHITLNYVPLPKF